MMVLLRNKVAEIGKKVEWDRAMQELDEITVTEISHNNKGYQLCSSGPKVGRPRADWLLESGYEDSMALFRKPVPNRPPFVYTDKPPKTP